ncbi:cation:proton antiporter [Pontibacter sp. HSC-14F20]|uniref:cation:proton antiporter n=1 Tax=Pontibacter sp. HSC-14F20 TaxID=2864136 RepID=UPI001C729DF8|nr:cation:proton antiporter [Pontibacter sp. HSC-14F20]MBX0333694.1 cation:proton antiporter [Pontibacter sp. HSC-14F20]
MRLLLKLVPPFEDPVLIFTLVLLIILIAPIILNKLKIPGIVGLILAGVIVGPNGFNLLQRDASMILFGTVGILYIMFLAGLEMDMIGFKKTKVRSIVYGALTFFIPIISGTILFFYGYEYEINSAVLLSCMFASHTLLAYPIVSKLGLTKNEAVTVTIGGTIITDTAVLLVLAVVAGVAQGNIGVGYWIKLMVSLSVFVAIVVFVFPIIAKWFFKQIESEKGAQFIFVLTLVFAAAFLAELAGVEAILGAFLAGLALNQLIPHTSALMNRLEFVGNNIFVPFFLISVGMLVDVTVLFEGIEIIIMAVVIIVLALVTKWVPAYITQKLYGYTSTQRNLMFGLSTARAAATLAVILVGYELQIIGETALNLTVVLILATSLSSSFITEKAARILAIIESRKQPDLSEKPDRIMVPIGNPKTLENLVDLAIMLKNPQYHEPIYPLAVVIDNEQANEEIYKKNKMLQEAIKHASATDHDVQLVSKIDINVASGILRAIKELMITEVVLGWNAKITTRDRIFGTILDNLLANTEQMILVCKIMQPLNTTNRLVVIVPANGELERGFLRWMRAVRLLSTQLGAKVVFMAGRRTNNKIKATVTSSKPAIDATYMPRPTMPEFANNQTGIGKDDMVVVISARKGTVSYNGVLDNVPRVLSRNYKDNSFIIIYPEQHPNMYQDNQFKTTNYTNEAREIEGF